MPDDDRGAPDRARAQRREERRRQIRRRRLTVGAVAAAAIVVVIVAIAAGSGGDTPAGKGERSDRRPSPDQSRAAAAADRTAVSSVLAYAPAIAKGGDRVKDIALTFDDGPGPDTAQILGILRRHHAPATFFVLGRSAETRVGRRTLPLLGGRDYPIGDHTMTHPPLASLGAAGQRAQISGQARLMERLGKGRPVLMRPPYGSFDATTLGLTRRERMLMVLWTADTKDFERPGKKQIVYTAVSAARPGAIILMHDGPDDRSQTVAALPRIILRLRQRGYRLVTIPQMLRENPPPRGQPTPRSLSGSS